MSASEAAPPRDCRAWPNRREDYELQELIGYGATAVVQAAVCKPSKEKVAIKRIDLEKHGANIDEMMKEILTMSQCKHENVVNYFTSFVVKHELWIVMRLLDGGSMLDIVKYQLKLHPELQDEGILEEAIISTVLKEVLRGLEYFHSNGLIHRDVKAGNILIATDGTVQLADFGVSSAICDYGDRTKPLMRKTFVGTPCWMAPEVMEQVQGYNHKADIWSFGITSLELATGMAPYAKYPAMKVLMLTLKNDPPSLDSCTEHKKEYKKYSKVFRKMIALCLQKDPEQRPDASELLKHQFFKKAKNKEFLKETLLPLAPPLGERAHKVKRIKGSSGRLHRSNSGSWVWSDEELADNEIDDDNKLKKSTSKESHSSSSKQDEKSEEKSGVTSAKEKPQDKTAMNEKPKDLTLRVRNNKKELNDIRFDFTPGSDTAEGVAQELVSAGLIDGQDLVVVAANLQKAIDVPPESKNIVFALASHHSYGPLADEKTLVGFAQLTINS